MDNNKTFKSKTSVIKTEGKDGFEKWNRGDWENVFLPTTSGGSEEELDTLEDKIPMKVMRFMGLPKSYRHNLYSEFVEDVKQLPAETASSFFNIVSWVNWVKSIILRFIRDSYISGNYKMHFRVSEKVRGKNETEEPTNKPVMSKSPPCAPVFDQGDVLEITGTSSTELIGSTPQNARINRADSIPSLKFLSSFNNPLDDQVMEQSPLQVMEVVHLEQPREISMHTLPVEKKNSQIAHILELDNNGNICRIPHACCSETSIYYGCGMSESENEGGYVGSSFQTTPLTKSEKEDENEEVKRVTFAPPSETDIYAYHYYEEEETEDTQTDMESKKSNSEEDLLEENITVQGHENIMKLLRDVGMEERLSNHVIVEEARDAGVQIDEMEDSNSSSNPASSSEDEKEDTIDETSKMGAQEAIVQSEKLVSSSTQIDQPLFKEVSNGPGSAKETSLPPPPKTSEVQLQLNKDLKTLENVVKNIYKNLNKKGPLTIVANFKPKENGELEADMCSLTGKPPTKKPEPASPNEPKEKNGHESTAKPVRQPLTPRVPEQRSPKAEAEYVCMSAKEEQKSKMAQLTQRSQSKHMISKASQQSFSAGNVEIMKHSKNIPSNVCHQHNHNDSLLTQNPQSSISVPKSSPVSTKLSVTNNKGTDDTNNNVLQENSTLLKPVIKQIGKMRALRPASSSHSVVKALPTPVRSTQTNADAVEVHDTRSRHFMRRSPSSQRIEERQALPPLRFKILDASSSQHYPDPVNRQSQQFVVSRPSPSASHNLLLQAPQPQQLYVETPESISKHTYMEAQLPQHSQQVFMKNPQSQHVLVETTRPLQHFLHDNPPPPTCPKPHLHPPSALSKQVASRNTDCIAEESISNVSMISNASVYSNISMATSASSVEESLSNISMISNASVYSSISMASSASSTCSYGECDLANESGREIGDTIVKEVVPIPIPRSSQHNDQCKHDCLNHSLSKNSSPCHLRDQRKQPTDKIITPSSSPAITKQYRTTMHIPTGPPKPSSYTAIFREKQKQQKQNTIYVDLPTKSRRKNR